MQLFIISYHLYFVVSKSSSNEVRETDSPTPPLLVHNHVMNNVDYNKEDLKNSVNEENHIAVKVEGSFARYNSQNFDSNLHRVVLAND